jgi:enoyl-CoA hydratase
MTNLVRYESDGSVAVIALDDGKANVMSVAMLEQINAALDRAQAEGAVVVLTGRPGMFSGGFDLAVFKQDSAAQFAMLKAGAEIVERLLSFPAPVVGACSGHTIAMGVFLLLACDVRVGVAEVQTKICMNEVQIGLTVPRFAIEVSRQRLTPSHFNRAAITAELYNPQQALEAGFLDYIVPGAVLMSVARDKAAVLSKLDRKAHVATKLRARAPAINAMRSAVDADIADWSRGSMLA